MSYKILSPRVGEVGADFVPDDGTNIEALIAGGFIADSAQTPAKSDKIATTEE